jgi:type I site-specific restriction endonuclease
VRGKLVTRGKAKRVDYVLYYQHFPIVLIEAKDNNCSVGHGMQQALDYAVTLDIPFVFASNGGGFVFHDRSGLSAQMEAMTTAIDQARRIDTAYEIYLGLYQAITGPEEQQKLFREFSPGFFDLIVIDECHMTWKGLSPVVKLFPTGPANTSTFERYIKSGLGI